MDLPIIKETIYKQCKALLSTQIEALETNLKSIVESRDNETKSSVGDKYETGRAMMQLEFQKVQSQLNRVKADYSELQSYDLNRKVSKVDKGCIVLTDQGIYFISVALGKVKVKDEIYFCISLASPIGKLLQQKVVNDQVAFNGKTIRILEIA